MSRFIVCLLACVVMTATVWGQADGGKPPVAPRLKSTATPSVDRDKLRDLLTLPHVTLLTSFGVLTPAPREKMPGKEKKLTAAEEIDALKNKLTGTAADAEVYLKLSDLYEDEKASREASAKAAELFPKRIAQDKQNGWLWAQYAQALLGVDKNGPAETAALKAIELAPKDWRCWQTLGLLRTTQMGRVLWGSAEPMPWEGSYQKIIAQAFDRKAPQADLDKAEKYLREAEKCYEKELAAAPDEPEVYQDRIGFHGLEMSLRMSLPQPFGVTEPKNAYAKMLRAVLKEAKELARLCPDDLEVQAHLAGMALLEGVCRIEDNHNPDKAAAAKKSPLEGMKMAFELMPPENKKIIREVTERLAKQARQKDFPEDASRNLATYSFFQGDLKTAERHARRAVRLGPKVEENWDLLEMVVAGKLAFDFGGKDVKAAKVEEKAKVKAHKIMEISRERLKNLPTARNGLVLAKWHANLDEFAEAETVLRAALQREPKDPSCTIGLAAVLLLKGDRASNLDEAGKCLNQVRDSVKDCADRDLCYDWNITHGVYLALSGQPRQSKELFESVLREWPDNERVKEALAAFSR